LLRFSVDGATNERHVGLGLELTEAIMSLKGIRAAMLVTHTWPENKLTEQLVLAKED
jgi:hypothetical protein